MQVICEASNWRSEVGSEASDGEAILNDGVLRQRWSKSGRGL
jgi:hypothetical protein